MSTEVVPAYRRKTGREYAIVTLTDRRTGMRRDYKLGAFGSAESKQAYHRLLAQWEVTDGRLPDHPTEDSSHKPHRLTLDELIHDYW